MNKKFISTALAVTLTLSPLATNLTIDANASTSTYSSTVTANPTSSKIYVNGTQVVFDAYTINGNNYFKIRDLAAAFNSTSKAFNVYYNYETSSVEIQSNTKYTSVGGELIVGNTSTKSATPTSSVINIDGISRSLTAYNIEHNNFVKLRDLFEILDISVEYDSTSGDINLDTSSGYTTSTSDSLNFTTAEDFEKAFLESLGLDPNSDYTSGMTEDTFNSTGVVVGSKWNLSELNDYLSTSYHKKSLKSIANVYDLEINSFNNIQIRM